MRVRHLKLGETFRGLYSPRPWREFTILTMSFVFLRTMCLKFQLRRKSMSFRTAMAI